MPDDGDRLTRFGHSESDFEQKYGRRADVRRGANGLDKTPPPMSDEYIPNMRRRLRRGETPSIKPEPSEYERLMAELEPVLKGLQLADADQEDIEFLTRGTTIPSERIAWVVQASGLARAEARPPDARPGDALPREVFYGWFRQGLPSSPDALFARPTVELIDALRSAIDQRVIPSGLVDRLTEVRATLTRRRRVAARARRSGETRGRM